LFNKNKTTLVAYPAGKQGAYTIPSSVRTITNMAFSGCTGLTSIINYAATPQTISSNVFTGVTTGNVNLYVPAGSVAAYRAAAVWRGFNILPIVPITAVSLNTRSVLLYIGDDTTLTATITPENATNPSVTWQSSNENAARVDNNGKVTAVAAGYATIYVYTQEVSMQTYCRVTVREFIHVTGVSLNMDNMPLYVGQTGWLRASLTPSNVTNPNLTWSSSNTAVARVDNGMVSAVAAGTVTIMVTTADGNMTASCIVRVSTYGNFDGGDGDGYGYEDGTTAVDVQSLPKLAVYPNPAGDMLYITDEYDALVEIYDLSGALLLTSTSHSINISALPSGIYIVKAGGKAAKVVKQ
jgi:hypothetical protein